MFMLPRGMCASDFIREVNRILSLLVNETPWKPKALLLVHVFVSVLQLPSPFILQSRMRNTYQKGYKSGDLDSLIKESNSAQAEKSQARNEVSMANMFCRYMMAGKIQQATRQINNDDNIKGVLKKINSEM